MAEYTGQGIWGVVLENREFGIRLLHVEPTEFLEDAVYAARMRIQSLISDKAVAETVCRNAAVIMYQRLPERRPLLPFEYGNILEEQPARSVESRQAQKIDITEEIASEQAARRLLMLIRDKYAKDSEKPHLQGLIDRLSLFPQKDEGAP